jgi:protein ImuA
MATCAVARETVFALRRQIAKIEGKLCERLETPAIGHPDTAERADLTVVRRGGVADGEVLLRTGSDGLDAALGGGLPKAALTEIHGDQTRDAGAAAGFMLALASLILKRQAGPSAPILWIGTAEIFREAGFPHARGLHGFFGIEAEALLFCEAKKAVDALWVAEEAARMTALSAVVLEMRGNPQKLDLTATRRLHARARDAGRPLFLLRHAAGAQPTAAPLRLVVSPSPAACRETIAGPLSGSIGRPAFTVAIGKGSHAPPAQFTLEWNSDERMFEERRTTNPVAVVSPSRGRTHPAPATGAVLAFPAGTPRAAGDQSPPEERPAHRRPRRTG